MTVPMRILIFGGLGLSFGTLMGILGTGGEPDWNYILATYIGIVALAILAHLRKWN